MDIRLMNLEDCEQVARLYKKCFSHPWSLRAIEEMFTVKGYYSLLVENDEKEIIAYIGMKTVCDEADITNVAVDPAYRRQGIAHLLLEKLLQQGKKLGIASIFLEVRASNDPAILLYRHAGFLECGCRKNYYDAPKEDALLMVWRDPSESVS